MDMYNYPPLFTKQRNEQTWAAQRDIWQSLILQYCQNENIWRLSASHKLFTNTQIDRSLKPEVAQELLDHVASNSRGEWTSKKQKTDFIVWWQTPAEIASTLKSWADDTGHNNSVLTIYEIQEGETIRQLLGVDETVLIMAIQELQKRGDGSALKDDGKVVGVKIT